MSAQSKSIVSFIGNLLPFYDSFQCDGIWCARSLRKLPHLTGTR